MECSHFDGDHNAVPGPNAERPSYGSYASFTDPDGNRWILQQVTTRLPGRGLSLDVATLTELFQETEQRHGTYEPTAPKHHWSGCTQPTWLRASVGGVPTRQPTTQRCTSKLQSPHKRKRLRDPLVVVVAGRPLFVGALQDVTESKEAEGALDRARSELTHVARVTTMSALTASIAHEVNQPLSGIITNARHLSADAGNDPPDVDGARETARRTLRDGNRASDVITRLRALFSKREFTLEPLDMNDVTREVVTLSMSDLQRTRIVLQSEFADDLPTITGDRIQLQQVVLNLLRNASDAMVAVDDRPGQSLIRTARDADDRVA